MRIRKRVLLSAWLLLLGCGAVTLGILAIRQHQLCQEYQLPYLQVETGKLGTPGKYRFPFEISQVTETGSLLIFTIPTLPEEAIPGMIFNIQGPAPLTGPDRLLGNCNYQEAKYACAYRHGVRPGKYLLEITVPAEMAALPGSLEVIILPHSEFGGILELLLLLGCFVMIVAALLIFFLAFGLLRQRGKRRPGVTAD